jgi:hypothetical protein
MYANMADPTQLRGVDGGYVENRTAGFHILNRDWKKDILCVNYILPGPGV